MRRAEMSDLDAVIELTVRAYTPWTEAFGYPPMPVTENYAPRIERDEVWLLEDSGAAAGLIVLEDDGASLLIFSVVVSPERQGEGLGLKLLAFAEDEARAHDRDVVRLYTNARMTRNIALYRRYGFTETGRRTVSPGRIAVDMEKRLANSVTNRRSA